MSDEQNKITPSAFTTPVLVTGAALYIMVMCWQGLGHEYVEYNWKPAAATILDPALKLPGKINEDRVTAGIEQTINYEYAVDGQTYRSNSVSKEMTVVKEHYPAGKAVEIFYNPADPAVSVLVRTPVQKQNLIGMIVTCALVIIVIIFLTVKNVLRRP